MDPLTDQWNNLLLNGSFPNDDAEFMAQLLGNSSLSNESSSGFSSAFWPADDSTTPTYPYGQKFQTNPLSYTTNTNNIFSASYSQDNGHGTDESYYLNESTNQSSSFSFGLMYNNNSSSVSSINLCFGENKTEEDLIIQGGGSSNNQSQAEEVVIPLHVKHSQSSMKPELPLPQISDNDHNYYFMENSKKRPRISSDHVVGQNEKKKNVKPKKNPNGRQSSKTSSCGCSEGGDDDIDCNNCESQSQSQSEDVSNGKGKGSRGSAGDPQSVYARKRREKINERLRILQNLVPNGTKVDISTMLEEAVQYVKFLQLQIKLLSSDDLWMYAPIAYNGMDIGLDMNIPTTTTTTTSS